MLDLNERSRLARYCYYLFQVQKQEESGISRDFETFECSANRTTDILGGSLQITSKNIPVTVQARMCLFEDFEKVSHALEGNKEVILKTKPSLRFKYSSRFNVF